MSSTGQYQCIDSYISTNYGVNWSSSSYNFIEYSSTGQFQISGNGYLSNNSGMTWTSLPNYPTINRLSASSTGQYITGIRNTSDSSTQYIYISSNYGNNWTKILHPDNKSYTSVAISSTGQYQIVCETTNNGVYVSNNYGKSWTIATSISYASSVSISGTGQCQIVCSTYFEYIKVSNNYGISFEQLSINNMSYFRNFQDAAISSDGKYAIVLMNDGAYADFRILTTISLPQNAFTFNLDTGTTFFITGTAPTANYSANFTLSTLNTSRTYLITLINKTSSVHQYYCNSVKINGTAVASARFLYTVRPSVITSSNALTGAVQTNQEFVMFYNTTVGGWYVLTNIKVFKAG